MTREEKYEIVLRAIAMKALKRKMLKDPPSIADFIEQYDFTAEELWELVEALGEMALDALRDHGEP